MQSGGDGVTACAPTLPLASLSAASSECPRRRETSCSFLLMVLDSAFPCAQASHSAGLEAAFQMGAVSASEGSSGGGLSEERFCTYIGEQMRQITGNSLPVIEAAARWSAAWERQRAKANATAADSSNRTAVATQVLCSPSPTVPPAAAADSASSLVPFLVSHWRRHDRHVSLLLRLNQLSARASTTQGQALLKICTEVWGVADGANDTVTAPCSCSAHEPLSCATADRTVAQLLAGIKAAWRTERLDLHFVPVRHMGRQQQHAPWAQRQHAL